MSMFLANPQKYDVNSLIKFLYIQLDLAYILLFLGCRFHDGHPYLWLRPSWLGLCTCSLGTKQQQPRCWCSRSHLRGLSRRVGGWRRTHRCQRDAPAGGPHRTRFYTGYSSLYHTLPWQHQMRAAQRQMNLLKWLNRDHTFPVSPHSLSCLGSNRLRFGYINNHELLRRPQF